MIDIEEFIELFNSKTQDSDSINIFELIDILNKKYKEFLIDYNNLKNLGLSESFNIQRYSKSDEYHTENMELELYNLNYPINDHFNAAGLIYKNINETGIVIKNIDGINVVGDSFREFKLLDKDVVESFLELGRKQNDFIDAYHELRSNCVLSNDGVQLYSSLYKRKRRSNQTIIYPRLINELENITLGLSIFINDVHHFLEFNIGLNENYGLIEVEKAKLNSDEFSLDPDSVIHILSSIRISRELLPKIFRQQKILEKRK